MNDDVYAAVKGGLLKALVRFEGNYEWATAHFSIGKLGSSIAPTGPDFPVTLIN